MENYTHNKLDKRVQIVLWIAIILISYKALTIIPFISGDGPEYLLMTESFNNHLTPNATLDDIESAKINYNQEFGYTMEENGYPWGYFEDKFGQVYSYHFWLYSLLVMPIKFILKVLGQNQLKAFQIFNAIMYCGMLLYINKKLKINQDKKNIILLSLIFNPAIYYIVWTHPEIYTFALITMSLTMFINKKYKKAIFTCSLAAMQNPPIIFLGGIYFLDYLIKNNFKQKGTIKKILITWLTFIPFFIPFIFYYILYGRFSLITSSGYIKFGNIFEKITSLFFDLNQGIIVYTPILLIIFIFVFGINLIKREYNAFLYGLGLVTILIVCATQQNWNAGSSGVNRYNVWILPILIYFTVLNLDVFKIKLQRLIKISLYIGLVFNFTILILTGGFVCKLSYVQLSPIAQVVLNHSPKVYNPEPEIFAERVLGKEVWYIDELPIIYANNDGSIKKVLVNNQTLDRFYEDVKINDTLEIEKQISKHKENEGVYYLSFANNEVEYKEDVILNEDNRAYVARLKETPATLEVDRSYVYEVNVTNISLEKFRNKQQIHKIGISYHWKDKEGNIIIFDGLRTYIEQDIRPEETINMTMQIYTPDTPGEYILELDIVQEGIAWFNEYGGAGQSYTIVLE